MDHEQPEPPVEFQYHCAELAYLIDQVEDDALRRAIQASVEELVCRLNKDWRRCTLAFSEPVPDDIASLF